MCENMPQSVYFITQTHRIKLQSGKIDKGNKYTSAINVKGEYLKKFSFELGDFVKVEVSKNKIVIQKNVSTELLNAMGTKNQALLTMIEGLSLNL